MWRKFCIIDNSILLLMASALFFECPTMTAASDASPFVGGWSSSNLDFAGALNNDNNCQLLQWTDRAIRLEPIAGNPTRVRGEWVRSTTAMWMDVKSQLCRYPGETKFVDFHLAVIGWTLSGTVEPSSGKLKLNGTFSKCDGNLCDANQGFLKDFETELVISGRELVDADPKSKPSDFRAFTPKGDDPLHADGMLKGVKPLLSLSDKGDTDELWDHMDSTMHKALTREQFKTNVAALRTRMGPIVSRSPMHSIYAIYGPTVSGGRKEFGIFVNIFYLAGNRSGLEYAIVSKESGDWKLGFYYLGPAPPGSPQ